jgi:hypothetical protein
MINRLNTNNLWNSVPASGVFFRPEKVSHLGVNIRRYLEHAITTGTELASAVRLKMEGEIKLKRWYPFSAEELISWNQGMIWKARVSMNMIPIIGFDRWTGGQGCMLWKIFGLIPIIKEEGDDISRSTAGRIIAELVWLPSVLAGSSVSWKEVGPERLEANIDAFGQSTILNLTTNNDGHLETVMLQRWGNPEGGKFNNIPFGGIVERESTFDGYTIPSQLRIGWYFGTDRFYPEGEFFRCQIKEAFFR